MLRYATLQDLERIIELAKVSSLFNYGKIIYSLLIENKCLFVMVDGSEIYGYVTAFNLTSEIAFCLQVAVCPTAKDRGLGTELMTHIETHMASRGVKTLFAHTTKERFYTYFTQRLNYLLWLQIGWFRIIRKGLPHHLEERGSAASAEL